MTKIISIVLIGLIFLPYNYSQEKPFGYKISGNGDIISDVFFIKDGFVLDSANVINKTYRFKYDENGRLIRDINFILYPTLDSSDSRIRIILLPGYRNYFYNENGDVDSVGTGIWRGTPPETDTAGYRINYTYDDKENLLSKIYSSNGEAYRKEENSYDSSGNLISNIVIRIDDSFKDTIISIREYDFLNRLTLRKSFRTNNPGRNIDQTIYQYDSLGNVSITTQSINIVDTSYGWNYYFEFDESGKAIYQVQSRGFNHADSTWDDSHEVLMNYDENDRILEMGKTFYSYNSDGNLDTLLVVHLVESGYMANKGKFLDSYGNIITFPELLAWGYFYYSSLITDVNTIGGKDLSFLLSQNYPNPFNPTTKISYEIPVSGMVSIKVYDILGKEIATLVNEEKNAGKYEVEFQSSADSYQLASGIYFYQLKAADFIQTKKMILIK